MTPLDVCWAPTGLSFSYLVAWDLKRVLTAAFCSTRLMWLDSPVPPTDPPGQTGQPTYLTHLPLVPHIFVSEWGQHWFRYWLAIYSTPSHYLNQCWVIVNWTLKNKLQWNFNKNTKLSFTKMHLKLSSAKWRPSCPGGDELTLHYCPPYNRTKLVWPFVCIQNKTSLKCPNWPIQFMSCFNMASPDSQMGRVERKSIKF